MKDNFCPMIRRYRYAVYCNMLLLDPSWCDGWLVYDSEIHLTIHNASGFPINIFGENSETESKMYKIKVTAMDMDKVNVKLGRAENRKSGTIF